jgi:predicted nucleotidyltransferase
MSSVEELLQKIESEYRVKILYACEAGSRAYEFATEKSDYDIRFIYQKPIQSYLSLSKVEDTITLKTGCYDIHGWDLRKALQLALKSNPSLYEWMHSNIVYRSAAGFMEKFQYIVRKESSKKVLIIHYLNMAKRNLRMYKENNKPSFLIHGVRASLMAELLLSGGSGTIRLQTLFKSSAIFTMEELDTLFHLKADTCRETVFALNETMISKIEVFVTEIEEKISYLPMEQPNKKLLEEIFLKQLGIKGEEDFHN